MPVEVLGLSNVPDAGEQFYSVDEKQAREIAEKRREKLKSERMESHAKVTLEDLYSQIQDGAVKEFNVILKADVQGSLEALRESLEKITRGNKEVRSRFIHCGVGDVNGSDVILAVASKAVIIAFNVGVGPKAAEELEKNPVDIRSYRIIYDAVNDIRDALEGMLEPDVRRNFMARVTVKEVFKLSKSGTVAGCIVEQGKVKSRADVDVMRNGDVIFTGKIATLKRFKDDVKEVPEGTECGIVLDKFSAFEPGDIIEAYTVERIARKL
jgi:translation initiation factor IF-2